MPSSPSHQVHHLFQLLMLPHIFLNLVYLIAPFFLLVSINYFINMRLVFALCMTHYFLFSKSQTSQTVKC